LKTLARDEKFIGATDIGFTAVLHTWGRQLVYHPHIHVIVPGGGLAQSGEWRPSHPRFLVCAGHGAQRHDWRCQTASESDP
jgi:hypothetical protein